MPKKKTGKRPKQEPTKRTKLDVEKTADAPAPAAPSEDSSDETTLPAPAPAAEALAAAVPSEEMDDKPVGRQFGFINLAPVDREIEIELLLRYTMNNWLFEPDHPTVLYSPQMFGSGKTFFARNLQRILREDLERTGPITKALLDSPRLSEQENDRCCLSMMRGQQSGLWTKELISNFANAQFVKINLKKLESPLDFARESLFRTVTGLDLIPEEFKLTLTDPETWVKCLERQRKPVPEHWFIFFDEIGAFEHSDSKTSGVNFREFFNSLEEMLFHKKCFVFCAGRSEYLALSSKLSSVLRVMLALGPLKVPQIIDAMQKTVDAKTGMSLCTFLGAGTVEKRQQLAEVIYLYTGGIPRLIRFTFEYLVSIARDSAIDFSDSALQRIMEGPVKKFVQEKSTIATIEGISEKFAHLYATAIFLSMTGQHIEKDATVAIDGAERPLSDVASALALYIEPVGDCLKIVFSKYAVPALLKLHTAASPLLNLMKSSRTLPVGTLSASNTLLFLVIEKLWHYIALAKKFGEIPGFESSRIASLAKPGKFFEIRYIPSFSATQKRGTHSEILIDGKMVPHNFNSADWNDLIAAAGLNVIGVPLDDNSAGPDVVLPISAKDVFVAMTMIAVKHRQNKTPTSWTEIADEVKKGLQAAADAKVPGPKLLLVISTQYTKEVEKAFSGDAEVLSLGEGFWVLDKISGRVRHQKKQEGLLFEIPRNCELRIFSVAMLKRFLGEQTFELMHELFSKESYHFESLSSLIDFHKSLFYNIVPALTPKRLKSKSRLGEEAASEESHSPPLSAAAAPDSSDGAATSRAAQAPAAAPAVERHLLFQNPDQEITLEWMHAVNEQILHARTRPGETLDEKLGRIITRFDANDVFTVGGLIKLSSAASMERWGIPGAIADELYLQCHPEKR